MALPDTSSRPAPAASEASGGTPPPRLSGGLPLIGHLLEMRRRPLELMQRCRDECGELGEFHLAGQRIVLMTGEEAQEAFFRAPDAQFDQAEAYPFMKPIFGEGIIFDAPPEKRKEMLRNRALSDKFMRGHAEVIARETERMLAGWGESGEIDLLDFFAELTIYTSSACLIGKEFREELTPEFATQYHELEKGTDVFAFVNPYLPIPSFRKRDRARRRLGELVAEIIRRREAGGDRVKDLLHALTRARNEDGTPRFTANQIAGLFIGMMFGGHHTTSTAASWTLVELLRHTGYMKRVVEELEGLYADGGAVSYHALREIPQLENVIKETLRLHPPLIILMRKVMHDYHYKQWTIAAGKRAAVSIAVSNRMPQCFPDPDRFDPERYAAGREEDKQLFAWLPFGAGRHRCVGAAFGMMQLKAIFSILLRRYAFEIAQPTDTYRNDHSKMVVQLEQPCRVRYRRRVGESEGAVRRRAVVARAASGRIRIRVDADLCQGHGVCVSEAPECFEVDPETRRVRILSAHVGEELRARVETAVRYCPTRALSFDED